MALYDYRCTKCDASWEDFYPMDEADTPTQEPCPECKASDCVVREISGTKIVSGVNLGAQVPGGFKEVLAKIKQAHPRNKIDGELS